jgi:hypothetical protein
MKTSIFTLIILITPLFLNFRFTEPNADLSQQMAGKWEVSYVLSQTLHTRELAAYTFQFQTGGQLVVVLPNEDEALGSWSVDPSKHEIEIHLGGNNALRHLENKWQVSQIEGEQMKWISELGNQEIMIQWKKH